VKGHKKKFIKRKTLKEQKNSKKKKTINCVLILTFCNFKRRVREESQDHPCCLGNVSLKRKKLPKITFLFPKFQIKLNKKEKKREKDKKTQRKKHSRKQETKILTISKQKKQQRCCVGQLNNIIHNRYQQTHTFFLVISATSGALFSKCSIFALCF